MTKPDSVRPTWFISSQLTVFVWEQFQEEEGECEWRGWGRVVWCFTESSIHLTGKKERREGVPVVGHNRRKPARGIPQAALTHRLEVSGATLGPTAALHRLLCSGNEFSRFYILLWHNWAIQGPQDFQPTCIINDVCIGSENDHLILDFWGWYRYKAVKKF